MLDSSHPCYKLVSHRQQKIGGNQKFKTVTSLNGTAESAGGPEETSPLPSRDGLRSSDIPKSSWVPGDALRHPLTHPPALRPSGRSQPKLRAAGQRGRLPDRSSGLHAAPLPCLQRPAVVPASTRASSRTKVPRRLVTRSHETLPGPPAWSHGNADSTQHGDSLYRHLDALATRCTVFKLITFHYLHNLKVRMAHWTRFTLVACRQAGFKTRAAWRRCRQGANVLKVHGRLGTSAYWPHGRLGPKLNEEPWLQGCQAAMGSTQLDARVRGRPRDLPRLDGLIAWSQGALTSWQHAGWASCPIGDLGR